MRRQVNKRQCRVATVRSHVYTCARARACVSASPSPILCMSQITTWDPTPAGAEKPGKETVDYASKHWSGLIRDYYANRVKITAKQAEINNAAGKELDGVALNKDLAQLAYEWTLAQAPYPTEGVGDALAISKKMHAKYMSHFAACSE